MGICRGRWNLSPGPFPCARRGKGRYFRGFGSPRVPTGLAKPPAGVAAPYPPAPEIVTNLSPCPFRVNLHFVVTQWNQDEPLPLVVRQAHHEQREGGGRDEGAGAPSSFPAFLGYWRLPNEISPLPLYLSLDGRGRKGEGEIKRERREGFYLKRGQGVSREIYKGPLSENWISITELFTVSICILTKCGFGPSFVPILTAHLPFSKLT